MESGDYKTGLQFHSTESIQKFLDAAVGSSSLSELALHYRDANVVPYLLLKNVWTLIPSENRPSFRSVLDGATFAFDSPKPREKTKELQERLQKLQELADQKAYKELVKDVVKEDRDDVIPFSTYKDQLGFGLHVIVTMFTGFLLGFALFRSQFHQSPVLHVVGGLLGLFVGMILETTLFIIRDYQYQNASKFRRKSTSRNRNSRVNQNHPSFGSKKMQ